MIDVETLDRNLKDCIQQWPMVARFNGNTFDVWTNATSDIVQTLDAELRDTMTLQVIAPRSTLATNLPKSMDDFELMVDGVNWIKFQVRDVPDYFDGATALVTINLQSVNKGVE